jgi:Domain of unknown function (DUF4328)
MAIVVAALLMTLGGGALLLSRKFAHAEHAGPTHAVTEPAAVETASKRARWAIFAVLASTVYRVVLSALEGPRPVQRAPLPHGVSAVLALVAAVLYLRWLHRAVANTRLLRAPIEWTPLQAVVAYFIPIVWFFRPYQVMKALHAGSDPSALHDAPVFRYRPAPNYREAVREPLPPPRWKHPAPIAAWWALYSFGWFWGIVGKVFGRPAAFGGALASHVATAVLCALIIRSVDARQRERHRRLEASAP